MINPLSMVSSVGSIASNVGSAGLTSAQGNASEMIAEQEATDAVEREKRMKRLKEALNWSKVGPGMGVSASAAAERAVTQ